MSDEHDWEAAYRLLAEREYARNIEPPTTEEIEACFLGTLPDEEAERIRERLAYYPELVRVMTTPIPERASLADPQSAENLERLRGANPADVSAARPPLRPLPLPAVRRRRARFLYSAAAVIALAIVGAYLFPTRQHSRPTRELAAVARILLPDGQRGGGQLPIPLPAASRFELTLVLYEPVVRPAYSVRILALGAEQRIVWQQDSLRRSPNGSILIGVSSKTLQPGKYRIEVHDKSASADSPVATYTVSISTP